VGVTDLSPYRGWEAPFVPFPLPPCTLVLLPATEARDVHLVFKTHPVVSLRFAFADVAVYNPGAIRAPPVLKTGPLGFK